MKKLLALLLALTLLLAGCGGNAPAETAPATTEAPVETTEATEPAPTETDPPVYRKPFPVPSRRIRPLWY